MIQKIKNYGLKKEPIIIGKDYLLGGFTEVPKVELQADGQWLSFLPIAENQSRGSVEPSSCVSMTTNNCVEILLERLYGNDHDFSDRFSAKMSGNTGEGATPQQVAQTLKNKGVVEETEWAFSPDIDTLEKYYADIPPETQNKALSFLENYDFLHEYVPTDPESLKQALKLSPLGIGTPAWYQNEQGLYYRPEGMSDNHFTTLIGFLDKQYWIVFDSYENNIKHLDWNINSSVAKRFHIAKKNDTFLPEKETNWLVDLLKALGYAFIGLIKKIYGKK